MFGLYPTLLKWLTFSFLKNRIVRDNNAFLKYLNLIFIDFWIRNNLLQTFLQTDMMFLDQLIVSSVKIGIYFAEFMILIALL